MRRIGFLKEKKRVEDDIASDSFDGVSEGLLDIFTSSSKDEDLSSKKRVLVLRFRSFFLNV
jgi:hypothetical protein